MIIGIDYRLAITSKRGMGRYCREIVAQLFVLDQVNKYILYVDRPIEVGNFPSNFQTEILDFKNYILSEQLSLHKQAKLDQLDILWCPYNTFPLFLTRRIKLIVTIHDLIFWNKPYGHESFVQKVGRIYRKLCISLGKKAINECLTVSQFSADQILKILAIKSTVTYNCIGEFSKLADTVKINKRENFFFTLSGDAPNKNLSHILKMFETELLDQHLIIAGVSSKSILRNRERCNIHFLPEGISDIELIKHYKTCKAFLFMSLKEGFGIPILEAAVCNAYIISSNTTSLPEIVGPCGVLINPLNKKELISSISNIDRIKIDKETIDGHISKFIHWEIPALQILNLFNS